MAGNLLMPSCCVLLHGTVCMRGTEPLQVLGGDHGRLGGAGRRLGRAELGQREGRWWRRRTYARGRRGTHKKKNAKEAEWDSKLIFEK